MPKYKIKWDSGHGEDTAIIDADSLKEAEQEAHDSWLEDAQMHADYSAELITDKDKGL